MFFFKLTLFFAVRSKGNRDHEDDLDGHSWKWLSHHYVNVQKINDLFLNEKSQFKSISICANESSQKGRLNLVEIMILAKLSNNNQIQFWRKNANYTCSFDSKYFMEASNISLTHLCCSWKRSCKGSNVSNFDSWQCIE